LRKTVRTRSAERFLSYILVAGIGLGIVLRFVYLGGQSLWVDELLTIKNAHIGEPGILSWVAHNLQGPAVSLLVHFWARLGMNEVMLRLPFAAAGAFTVPAVYVLAREFTDPWTSVHTAFLAALSPILIWYSQEVRGYAFVILFAALSTYFLAKWVRGRRPSSIALYSVCLFAGLVSNLSMAFMVPVHLVYMALKFRRPRALVWWVVAVCVVMVAFSPWLREIAVRVHPERIVTGGGGEAVGAGTGLPAMALPYTLFTFGLGYTLGPSPRDLQLDRRASLIRSLPAIVLGAVILGIPLLTGILRALRTDRSLLIVLSAWIVIPAILVAALAARNIKVFNPRYLLVALPAYLMLFGIGLAAISRSRYALFLIPVVLVLGLSIRNYYADPHYSKDDLRAAAAAIKEDFAEGDVVTGVYAVEPLEFYLNGVADVKVFGLDDVRSDQAMAERCREIAGDGPRVWLSLCREWHVDPDGYIHKWFEANLDRLESRSFPGVSLFLYGKRGT
jgi:mannosyltransferase